MRNWMLKASLFWLIVFHSPGFLYADQLLVNFAGFAFRGQFADIQKNYPNVFSISQEKLPDGRGLLDDAFGEKLKGVTLKHARIVEGSLANLGDGSLTLACGFDTEFIDIEKYEDGYKIVVDLGAQILLLDYSQMRLVASFPIIIELIDFRKKEPDKDELRSLVKRLILTQEYKINLIDDFVQLLCEVEIKKSYGSAIKVTKVNVKDQAIVNLPAKFSGDLENFKTFVAQGFGKYLSINQRVAILPYNKGADIGNKMALTFSEARVFQIEIPEPQFTIELSIDKFKKVCTDQKSSGACWVYGTFANIRVVQPALGKVYVDEKVKKGVSKIIPRSQVSVKDWSSYQNSLLALFNEVTKQFSTEKKFNNVRKVIEKCI